MRTQERTLRLWRDVEAFQVPDLPGDMTRQTYKARAFYKGSDLPWEEEAFASTDRFIWTHTIYLGEISKRSAYLRMTKQISRNLTEGDELNAEAISGAGFSAIMTVGHDGLVLEAGYEVASYVPAFRLLMRTGEVAGLEKLISSWNGEFDRRMRVPVDQDPISRPAAALAAEATRADPGSLGIADLVPTVKTESKFDSHTDRLIGWAEIFREENALRHLAPGLFEDWNGRVLIVSRRHVKGRVRNAEPALMNSFYLKDLDRLVSEASEGRYLGAPLTSLVGPEPSKRRDVLQDKPTMMSLLSPERLPVGRWPSPPDHPLSLGQQAAVGGISALGAMKEGVIAVNGPPGTGKTTLLRDVIADIVTRRASKMAKYDQAKKLFSGRVEVGRGFYFKLNPEIFRGTGIVVSSNNNAAVENISLELPDTASIDRDAFPDADYFSPTASDLLGDGDGWAAIAGCLGNAGNRTRFLQAWFDDSRPQEGEKRTDLKGLLEGDMKNVPIWGVARKRFQELEASLEARRTKLMEVHSAAVDQAPYAQEVTKLQAELEKSAKLLDGARINGEVRIDPLMEEVSAAETKLREAEERLANLSLEASIAVERATEESKVSRPVGVHKFLERAGVRTPAVKEWEERAALRRSQVAETRARAAQARAGRDEAMTVFNKSQSHLNTKKAEVDKALKGIQNRISLIEKRLAKLSPRLEAFSKTLDEATRSGVKVPTDALLSSSEEKRQLESVWVDPEFDRLRSELFIAALDLHKALLYDQRAKFITGLRLFTWHLQGSLKEPDSRSVIHDLWDLLFCALPVVSTSLASLPKMFRDFERGELPWLLIDEAGQATPGSVAGAMWRAKRAVVVGDPQQIPPVVTVPTAVINHLMRVYQLDTSWSPAEQSAQTLTDRSMPIGAWIGDREAGGVWGGLPLRAHRRCGEPMFSISNAIAYDGQMVQAGKSDRECPYPLGPSSWINVSGHDHAGIVAREEIRLMSEVAKWTLDWNQGRIEAGFDPMQIFMISPFRRVADELRSMIRRTDKQDTGQLQAGTVHTFQGREASVVFLVLGSQPGAAGAGSRSWAGSEPNLLNVAVTRAKDRLYVIGSVSDWGRVPGFDMVADGMRNRNAILTPGVLMDGQDRSYLTRHDSQDDGEVSLSELKDQKNDGGAVSDEREDSSDKGES